MKVVHLYELKKDKKELIDELTLRYYNNGREYSDVYRMDTLGRLVGQEGYYQLGDRKFHDYSHKRVYGKEMVDQEVSYFDTDGSVYRLEKRTVSSVGGLRSDIYLSYDGNGEIMSGSKTFISPSNLYTSYEYRDGTFVKVYEAVRSEEYIDKDGKYIKIDRELVDGTVVNDMKYVAWVDSTQKVNREYYYWDNKHADWWPHIKFVEWNTDTLVNFSAVTYPDVIDDNAGYSFDVAMENRREDPPSYQSYNYLQYCGYGEDWLLLKHSYFEREDLPGEVRLMKKFGILEEGSDSLEIRYVMAEDSLLVSKEEKLYKGTNLVDYSLSTYEYAFGRVLKTVNSETNHGNIRTVYEFSKLDSTPTAIEEVEGIDRFHVAGHVVIANGSQKISVYDMSGRLVTEGHGRVSLPQSGLYIVKSGLQQEKVFIAQ